MQQNMTAFVTNRVDKLQKAGAEDLLILAAAIRAALPAVIERDCNLADQLRKILDKLVVITSRKSIT